MTPLKILLVEDELDLANNLKELLENLNFTVVGIFDEGSLVLDYLKLNKVDLLVLDIMIKGDINGIDLAKEIRKQYQLPIVFITAFSENEILKKALEVDPDGYLLKPFTKENLKTTLALAFSSFNSKVGKPASNVLENRSIQIGYKGFKLLLSIDEILVAKADGLYTKIFTKNKAYVVRDILKDVESKLPSEQFLRVHKSYVVNKRHITHFSGKIVIIDDKEIPIRRGYFKVLKTIMN
jgi:two-component system, LytTR family, response regulator LytT